MSVTAIKIDGMSVTVNTLVRSISEDHSSLRRPLLRSRSLAARHCGCRHGRRQSECRARGRHGHPIVTFDSLAADRRLIQRHSLSNESFERRLIDLLALLQVDRTAQIAFEAGVEQV